MRSLTTREADLLQSSEYRAHFRVYFEDADGNMEEITNYEGRNWVESIEISTDIDAEGKSFTFNIKRNRNKRSFSPLMKGSPFNVVNELYKPKIFMGRKFLIEIALTGLNGTPEPEWWKVFERGYLNRVQFHSDPMVIQGSCDSSDLLRAYIKTERQYGSETGQPVENAMQQILDDNGKSEYDLVVPTSPNWNIYPYIQRKEKVYAALRELAHQIGWEVKPRFNNGTGDIELMLYEPERDPNDFVWSFTPGDYTDVRRLEMGIENIRNYVRVVYSDINVDDEDGNPGKRQAIERFDQDSIDAFGEIYMEISESSVGNINTATEAITLAENSLHDLKEPKADQQIETGFFYPIQLNDFVEFQPNGVHFDRIQKFGVVGYRHNIKIEEGKLRTVLTTKGRPNMSETGFPVGMTASWLEREALPAIAKINKETTPIQPQDIITHSSIKGITVAWAAQENREVEGYNVYCSNTSAFTANNDRRVARGSSNQFNIATYYNETTKQIENMVAGEIYYIKLRGYNEDGQLGNVSIEVSERAGQTDEASIADGSITEPKLANGAATEDKIGTGSVTEDKIGTGSVTETKLGNGSVSQNKVQDNAINSSKTFGATGTFTTSDGKTITVTNGLITDIT
jgi:hypothetical protein